MKNKPSIIELIEATNEHSRAMVHILYNVVGAAEQAKQANVVTLALKAKLDAWGIGQQIDWDKAD